MFRPSSQVPANFNFPAPGLQTIVSGDLEDERWDTFLSSVPEGQFQHTSAWSRVQVDPRMASLPGGLCTWRRRCRRRRLPTAYKKMEGTTAGRIREQGTCGLGPEPPGRGSRSLEGSDAQAGYSLQSVVQAPDRGILASRNLAGATGSTRQVAFWGVIENTLVNELPADSEPLKASLRKSTRYGVNRAMREGVTIEFGRREPILPEFFNLMQGNLPPPTG